MAGHNQCRSAAAGHRNDAGVVERACKFFEEIKVSNALAIALWSIATGPRATRAGSSRTGPGSLRALRRAPGLVDGAPAPGRRPAPGCAVHREKAVQRSRKGVRRICAGVRAPRARAHQRRPRHHGLNVFTACDQEFHVVGGGHDALLRHYGAHRRRRCNTGTGFRSTCGRFPSATHSWCVQQRRARPSMFTMGCCITLVTTPVPYGVPRLAMRPFYNVATRRCAAGRRSV